MINKTIRIMDQNKIINYVNAEAELLFTEEEIKILKKEIQAFYRNFNDDLSPAHHPALINMVKLIGSRLYRKVPEYGGDGVNIIYRNTFLDKIKLKVLNSVKEILFPNKQSI